MEMSKACQLVETFLQFELVALNLAAQCAMARYVYTHRAAYPDLEAVLQAALRDVTTLAKSDHLVEVAPAHPRDFIFQFGEMNGAEVKVLANTEKAKAKLVLLFGAAAVSFNILTPTADGWRRMLRDDDFSVSYQRPGQP